MKTLLLKLLIFTAFFQQVTAQSGDIASYLDSLHRAGSLNGSVLIKQNEAVVFEQSYGFADGARQTPLTAAHRFNLGSVYKELPAVAIMQLDEGGRINTDAMVGNYVPGLPSWGQEVSVRQLLQYTGGLPRVDWRKHFSAPEPVTGDDLWTDLLEMDTLVYEPGTDYLYTNLSPFVLIKVVEAVTDMPFAEYVSAELFRPAGMTTVTFEEAYPYPDPKNLALPFNAEYEEDRYRFAVKNMLVCANPQDMVNWFETLDRYRLIREESYRQLAEEAALDYDNIQAPLGSCDWLINGELRLHSHHGSSGNYECRISNYAAEGLTIAVMTNQKNGNVTEIVERLYGMSLARK